MTKSDKTRLLNLLDSTGLSLYRLKPQYQGLVGTDMYLFDEIIKRLTTIESHINSSEVDE